MKNKELIAAFFLSTAMMSAAHAEKQNPADECVWENLMHISDAAGNHSGVTIELDRQGIQDIVSQCEQSTSATATPFYRMMNSFRAGPT